MSLDRYTKINENIPELRGRGHGLIFKRTAQREGATFAMLIPWRFVLGQSVRLRVHAESGERITKRRKRRRMEDAGCREAVRPSRSLRPQAEVSVRSLLLGMLRCFSAFLPKNGLYRVCTNHRGPVSADYRRIRGRRERSGVSVSPLLFSFLLITPAIRLGNQQSRRNTPNFSNNSSTLSLEKGLKH